jgi:hypothetical protein
MSRKRQVTTAQIEKIRQYTREGCSANQIQHKLSTEHIGLRRTVLLSYVRQFKRQPTKPSVERYAANTYGKSASRTTGWGTKAAKIKGTHHGKYVEKQRLGSGYELYRFVRNEMESDFWDDKPTVES